jgi:hypothetical protein
MSRGLFFGAQLELLLCLDQRAPNPSRGFAACHLPPQGQGCPGKVASGILSTRLGAGRKIRRREPKNFSGRGAASTVTRPEILFSLALKDNFDPPKGGCPDF